MRWMKKGLIFRTQQQYKWMFSHAQCPTAIVLEDKIRIFFSVRKKNQESLPVYIDVDKKNPKKILYLHPEPVINKGRYGSFDENGITPSFLFYKNSDIYFYYAGWSQSRNVPYKNFTGLAISKDNANSFVKYSEGPVLGMNKFDAFSATGPCIVYKNNKYYAIYSTGIEWINIKGKLEHRYLLTYAISQNAIDWIPSGKIIIKPENRFEAHCKPAIIEKDGIYHMWFSKRGSHNFRNPGKDAYRIAYAYSEDLINWVRDDKKAGIETSPQGWDSEMICYPSIVQVENTYIMFYNGNGFGKSGFGYAELKINN